MSERTMNDLSFQQLFALSLGVGVAFFVAIIALHLPVMITYKWIKLREITSIRSMAGEIIESSLIHNWIGSLSAIFWMSVLLYLFIAVFGACLLWVIQQMGLFDP